jgi:hypothetical protein
MNTGTEQNGVKPQVQEPSVPQQRGTEHTASAEVESGPTCARCGRSDGPLEPEVRWKDALVCSFSDRDAWSECWRKSGPHCPPWCVGTHRDELGGIELDDVWPPLRGGHDHPQHG